MHFTKTTAVATLVAAASAFPQPQGLSNLPSCALPAIEGGITHTTCALTDYTCICASTDFIDSIQAKIQSDCNPADQATTLNYAKQTCASAGADLKIGDDTSAPASAAAPAAAAAPTEVPSAAPAAESSAPTSSAAAAAPTVSPPYPVGANGSVGGANGTNATTTPFLGAAVGRQSSGVASVVALLVSGVFGVWLL